MKRLIASALPVLMAACTDPAAVRSFADQTPPVGSYSGIIQDYGSISSGIAMVRTIRKRSCPVTVSTVDSALRGLDPMHESWITYMAALGRLADDKLVTQAGPDVEQVKAGLGSLKGAFPGLSINDTEIVVASSMPRLVADAALRKIRQDALIVMIAEGEAPFQNAMDIEIAVIQAGYLVDLQTYSRQYDTLDRQLRGSFSQSLSPRQSSPVMFPLRQAAAQASCLALLSASGHLPPRSDVSHKREEAQNYLMALKSLKLAHTALYNSESQILTKTAYKDIKPLVDDARAAWSALIKLQG